MSYPVATKFGAHLTSALLAGAYAAAQSRHFGAWQGDLSGISPDELILMLAFPAVVFAVLFGIGHAKFRHFGARARIAYSILGAFGLVAASAAAMPMHLLESAVQDGLVSVFVVLSATFGALIGFLHLRSVGREYDENESEQLEDAIGGQKAGDVDDEALADVDTGVVQTRNEVFYDGPLQVITSGNAMFGAALAGAFAHFLYSALVGLVFSNSLSGANNRFVAQLAAEGFFSGLVLSLLFSIFICLTVLTPAIFGLHKLLGVREKIDMGSYVVAGALAPLAVGLAMFGIGLLLTHWLVLPLAVAMGTYRHLAGLEPAALPEDIEVSDRRTLVGRDHVRRRMRRIVN